MLLTGLLPAAGVLAQADTMATAANDTVWRSGGIASLNFSQVSLSQWAAGGDNSVSGNALVSLFANMKKGKWAWDNTLDAAVGGSRTGDKEIRKTDDKLDANSKAGYELASRLYATFLLNFKTQFTEGFTYDDNDDRTRISHLLTPAYIVGSAGMDWKPSDGLDVYLSPVTMKTTIVNDPLLLDRAELTGTSIYGVEPGKKTRFEMGAYFTGSYSKSIMDNVLFKTKVELFSNYSNNPQNIDANWETIITFKVNSVVNALLTTQLVYDDDVDVPRSESGAMPGPGTQFKETFSLGFAWKFSGYGVHTPR